MIFRKLENPTDFFTILPQDWLDELMPQWAVLEKTAEVYVVIKNNEVISGGIVFNQTLPRMTEVEIQASVLFKSASYIGYVFTQPQFRGIGASSFWFHSLFDRHKHQGFWLSIEDIQLSSFYQKLGFSMQDFHEKSIDEYIMFRLI